MNQEPDIFDQIAARPSTETVPEAFQKVDLPAQDGIDISTSTELRTPYNLRKALQFLLANGWLEEATKPAMYRLIAAQTTQLNLLLEPLDLRLEVDDVRGLAFLAVRADEDIEAVDESEQDDWTHPLMRRQRLNLEQSLLLAILRREFLQREQESGTGAAVRITVESLLPQLETYLGTTGSDLQERRRLNQLLDHLRTHGMVSEADAQDCITIRPMIVHLLNPENLQALLLKLRDITEGTASDNPDHAS